MLQGRVDALVRELLPAGRREGPEWRVGSLAGEKGKSMAVHLGRERAGVWADFQSGQRGDVLDLVAAVRFGGNKAEALRWSRAWLGLDDPSRPFVAMPVAPRERQVRDDAEDRAKKSGAARALWLGGQLLGGTPAAAYLDGRGIGPGAIGRAPGALRFRPDVWCSERQRNAPAMLAACVRAGRIVACHRTFLEEKPGGIWGKASIRAAKKVLGPIGGAFIPVWRGRSGRPVAEAPEDDTLIICEGIEDALTLALHLPECRVFAAYSLGNIASLQLPPVFADIVLAFDRDGENPQAREGRAKAADALLEQGRSVREMLPPDGFKDFNQWWIAERSAAGRRA